MDPLKRTWAEIDLDALLHNYTAIRESIPAGCKFLAVVKADAYGHGAVQVSRLMERAGADYLAVSCLDEALELRTAGITMPILILGHTPPEYTDLLIKNNITQTVSCEAKAKEFSEAATNLGGALRVHIKVDTGMSRLGFLCSGDMFDEGVAHVITACTLPGIVAEGIYTHFAVSDEPGDDCRTYTLAQYDLFTRFIKAVEEKGSITFSIRHCANSGAVVNYPHMSLDMVRPGLLLYGYGDGGKLGLRPAMSLITRVSTIKHYEPGTAVSYGGKFVTNRTTRVGVLPIGYADGLLRCLSGKFSVYSEGGFAPQLGRICMDMCMVDLTDLPSAEITSRVEIFGKNAGLEELSEKAGTIPYELMCSVSKRVPRVYLTADVPAADCAT